MGSELSKERKSFVFLVGAAVLGYLIYKRLASPPLV